ncbi:MAG: hypothetical protein ACRCVJ_18550 [Clostridium sp.]|uniref:hypothetical protein n=1 Tax=Clostridium sp. TaxID=1506 RepID=UPI003F3D1647
MTKKLRVVHYPQIPCKGFKVEVKDEIEAKKIMDVLADYDLFQYENKIKPDYCNSTILEQYNEEDKQWEDWFDDKSGVDDIDEYLEQFKDKNQDITEKHCILISYDENGNSIYFVSINELNGVVSTANRDEATVLNYEDAMSLQSHFRGREQVWDIDY